ncbi:MAG: hypothetical protein M0R40_02270 [Firmicutes bacterium]|nr:hypothetical protein [Bacillota bacterium]
MIKRIAATMCFLIVVTIFAGGAVIYCEEQPPEIYIKLKDDGSTGMTLNLTMQGGDVAQMADIYRMTLEDNGYTVDFDEGENTMNISQDFPVEDGYFLDLLFFGAGRIEFAEFKNFFSTGYAIKTTVFNQKNSEPGQVRLKLNIETPVKAKFSNAIIREKRNNLWEIASGQKNEISMGFKKINTIPLVSTLFAFIILILLVVFAITNTKKQADKKLQDAEFTETVDALPIQDDEDNEDLSENDYDAEEPEDTEEGSDEGL